MTRLVFVDTETTGLDPDLHEVWEVACIVRELPDDEGKADGKDEGEYVWQLPVDLGRADPFALNVGRFHERRHAHFTTDGSGQLVVPVHDDSENGPWETIRTFCDTFARLTWGAHLVGAVVSFDEERLRRLLRRHGACPGWHYHLIDVENLAAGYVLGRARGIARVAPSTVQASEIRAKTGIDLPDIGQFFGALDRVPVFARKLPWSSEEMSLAVGVDPDKHDRHTALGDARWAQAIYDKIMDNR